MLSNRMWAFEWLTFFEGCEGGDAPGGAVMSSLSRGPPGPEVREVLSQNGFGASSLFF